MLVPNVIGTTVGEAKSMIEESAGLSVGNVTVTQRRAMLERLHPRGLGAR